MTQAQYQRELEKLEREADKRGCCVIPARPLREPKAKPPRKRQTQRRAK
jgi:hypothetical protein